MTAPEPPIACTLAPTELTARRGVWMRLADRALREQTEIAEGVSLRYASDDGVEDELRALAVAEAGCCSFARWTVSRAGDDVVLDVTAEGDGVAAVRAMFSP